MNMNVSDERARLVHERAKQWKIDRAVLDETFPLRWKSNSIGVQVVFFFLTCLGLGAFYGFWELIADGGFITALVAIALAEYLIDVRGWFGTGVESALWIGGLMSAITLLPSSNRAEGLLVFAAAFAIAGVRVRNPIFGAAAVVFVAVYFEEKLDAGVLVAIVIASLALLALLRTWQRPSTEWLLIMVAVVLPVAGWPMADAKWQVMTIALYAAFGGVSLLLALWKRHHAMFVGGAIGITVASVEIGKRIATPLEVKLAAGGAFLLAMSWIVARVLRDRTHGFVMTPAKLTPMDEALQVAATVVLAPREPEIAAPKGEGGGSFGGAGATGEL